MGDNDSKDYTIDEFQNGDGSSFSGDNGAIKGWCLMEGYEPGVTELKIRFDGEEDKGKITVEGAEVAVDGDRDGIIKFGKESDKEMIFWVNNDHDDDERDWQFTKVEDDYENGKDCEDNKISCKRDLEDFARIHFKFGVIDGTVKYYVKLTGGPEINLFEAYDHNGEIGYLNDESEADGQIKKTKIITIDSTEREIPIKQINANDDDKTCYLFEGANEGAGELIIIAKKNGVVQSEYKIILRLLEPNYLFDYYKVICSDPDNNIVEPTATRLYTTCYPNQNDDYLLFVHGWNMDDEWEKKRWTETIFKRLYWLGYKGKVGLFSWPTLFDFDLWQPWDARHYDTSEYRAWQSAEALKSKIKQSINGNVCIISHSMGNIIATEALRLSNDELVNTFISTQAAIPGHCFDATLESFWDSPDYKTPNLYSVFPYDVIHNDFDIYMFNKENSAGKRVRMYNEDDFALDKFRINHIIKPDYKYNYKGTTGFYFEPHDRFYFDSNDILPGGTIRNLVLQYDKYEIFSFCAESRSLALGAEADSVSWFDEEINLEDNDYGFDNKHYSHSRQFRSTIQKEWNYWKKVKEKANF